jgi:hypothetical protein
MTMEQNLARRNAMLTDVISHLEQYLQDTQGCDHSVGICACELRNTLDDFGVYCHTLTGGIVGWPNLRFDVTEADANNASFRKGTIND